MDGILILECGEDEVNYGINYGVNYEINKTQNVARDEPLNIIIFDNTIEQKIVEKGTFNKISIIPSKSVLKKFKLLDDIKSISKDLKTAQCDLYKETDRSMKQKIIHFINKYEALRDEKKNEFKNVLTPILQHTVSVCSMPSVFSF